MTTIKTDKIKTNDKDRYDVKEIKTDTSILLSQIPDKPKSLYIRGNENLLSDPTVTYICIVGSRRFTSYGKEACEMVVKSLINTNTVVISGLALGIDGLCHQICIENNIPCIAVPGSSVDDDTIYPRSHIDLAHQILEHDGLLLSELPVPTRASPWSFPMRNRIMAGLSHAVLIIEGEEDSGTLITARLALEYNRDVFAIPGSIFSESSKGPLSLIKRGAIPICNSDDIKEALGLKKDMLFEDSPLETSYTPSTEDEIAIICALHEPKDRHVLMTDSQLDISKLQIILSILEIKNIIKEELGMFSLTDQGRILYRKLLSK
jgi:DNA processing protein